MSGLELCPHNLQYSHAQYKVVVIMQSISGIELQVFQLVCLCSYFKLLFYELLI